MHDDDGEITEPEGKPAVVEGARNRQRAHEERGHTDHQRDPATGPIRPYLVGEPGIGGIHPPQDAEDQENLSRALPGEVSDEERGELGEREDEYQVEEQLQGGDPLLVLVVGRLDRSFVGPPLAAVELPLNPSPVEGLADGLIRLARLVRGHATSRPPTACVRMKGTFSRTYRLKVPFRSWVSAATRPRSRARAVGSGLGRTAGDATPTRGSTSITRRGHEGAPWPKPGDMKVRLTRTYGVRVPFMRRSAATSSAIWAVFSAAPLRRLSPQTKKSSECGSSSERRSRPTQVGAVPTASAGVGHSPAAGSSQTTTPGASRRISRACSTVTSRSKVA